MIEGRAVAPAKEQKPVLDELETAYLAWSDHFASAVSPPSNVEGQYRLLRNALRGFGTTLTLFPHTPVNLGRFCRRYTVADPLATDWFNVGRDLYSAILKYGMANQSSDRHSRETEPADPVCSR